MGVLPIQETIPLQILDPFTQLCEVGHTFTGHGSIAQIVGRLLPESARGGALSRLLSRIRAYEAPSRCVILLTA
jgi:hypothetical protein